MIDRIRIKSIATQKLDQVLRTTPYALEYVKRNPEYNSWLDKCHIALNRLDLEGYVRTRFAMVDFISKGVLRFASQRMKRHPTLNESLRLVK